MDITLAQYHLLTGNDFADGISGNPSTAEVEQAFSMIKNAAKLRLHILLSAKNETELTEIAREKGMEILLQLLLARMIGVILAEQEAQENIGLSQKVVEDFRIQFNKEASPAMAQYLEQNADIIAEFRGLNAIYYPRKRPAFGGYGGGYII